MALKDWKKKNEGKRIYFEKLVPKFGSKSGSKVSSRQAGEIQINPPSFSNSYWRVNVSENLYSSPNSGGDFKTKSQALAFAKKYMRSH